MNNNDITNNKKLQSRHALQNAAALLLQLLLLPASQGKQKKNAAALLLQLLLQPASRCVARQSAGSDTRCAAESYVIQYHTSLISGKE